MICNPANPNGMSGFTDWWSGLFEETTTLPATVGAGAALLSPITYVGEGTRYVVRAGVDAAGRAVSYVWDTAADQAVDVRYGTPGTIPVTTPPFLPTGLTKSSPETIGGETDPGAVDRLVSASWQRQQQALEKFFAEEAERGKKKEEDTGIWLYLLIAGGAVLLLR